MPSLNTFAIYARGADFDVNAFVASSPLKVDRVDRKGESRNPEVSKHNRLVAYLGDGTALSISEQENVAVEYLQVNREALRELGKYPGVTNFVLNLQYVVELMPGTVGFNVEPSPVLMRRCLDVGIAPWDFRKPAAQPAVAGMVYVTTNDTNCHRPDCRHLDASAKAVPLEEAKKTREPCKACRPE